MRMDLKQPIIYIALVFLLYMAMLGGSSKLSAYPAQFFKPYEATETQGNITPDQRFPVASIPSPNLSPGTPAYAPEPNLDKLGTKSLRKINLKLRRGHNLYTILRRQGVGTSEIDALARSIRPVFDLKDLKPGKSLRLNLSPTKPTRIMQLSYAIDATTRLEVWNLEGAFHAFKRSLNQNASLPAEPTPVQPEILPLLNITFLPFPEMPVSEEDPLSERIETTPPDATNTAMHQTTKRHSHAGKSLHTKKMFLKAPLQYRRISSGFSHNRRHPIYHVRRPHLGIDYAAPMGTAVHSVGPGTVVFRGWSKGFGRCVQVRHPRGYTTYYGHLSKFPRNLSVGSRVEMGRLIGYVGQSGIATGPHLDFRISHHGRFINPAKLGAIKRPV